MTISETLDLQKLISRKIWDDRRILECPHWDLWSKHKVFEQIIIITYMVSRRGCPGGLVTSINSTSPHANDCKRTCQLRWRHFCAAIRWHQRMLSFGKCCNARFLGTALDLLGLSLGLSRRPALWRCFLLPLTTAAAASMMPTFFTIWIFLLEYKPQSISIIWNINFREIECCRIGDSTAVYLGVEREEFYYHDFWTKIPISPSKKIMEFYSHHVTERNISWNQILVNFFKNVGFTNFLSKECEGKSPSFLHCEIDSSSSIMHSHFFFKSEQNSLF